MLVEVGERHIAKESVRLLFRRQVGDRQHLALNLHDFGRIAGRGAKAFVQLFDVVDKMHVISAVQHCHRFFR